MHGDVLLWSSVPLYNSAHTFGFSRGTLFVPPLPQIDAAGQLLRCENQGARVLTHSYINCFSWDGWGISRCIEAPCVLFCCFPCNSLVDHSGWPTGQSFGTLTCAGIDPGGYLLLHLCHGPMDPASDAAPWTRRGCALCRLWPWPAEELILGHARRALFRRLSRRRQGGNGQQIPKWTHAWNRCRCGTIWKESINHNKPMQN